jgi:hypothetical protein
MLSEPGPYLRITASERVGLAEYLDEQIGLLDADVPLLVKQLELMHKALPISRGRLASLQEWIDLRISAEHVIVYIARVLPFVSSALADLVATTTLRFIAERDDFGGRALPKRTLATITEGVLEVEDVIKRAQADWSALQARPDEQGHGHRGALARAARALGQLHLGCVVLLDAIVQAECSPAPRSQGQRRKRLRSASNRKRAARRR